MISLPGTAVLLLLIALCQYVISEDSTVGEHEGSNCIYFDDAELCQYVISEDSTVGEHEGSNCIYFDDAEDDDCGLQYERVVELFERFKKKFMISYSDNNEHTKRLEVFKTNLQRIKVLQERELGTAKYGITKFADLTEDEFRLKVSCLQTASDIVNVSHTYIHNGLKQAVLTSVKNQDDDGGVAELFELFKKKFKISYSDNNEHTKRLEVFKTNLQRIKVLQERELGTAKYGITKFADLTEDEFRQMVSCTASDVVNVTRTGNGLQQAVSPNVTERIPKDFDWRDYGAVTPVKNQGTCGSCWAFGVVGNIESLWAIQSGKKAVSLSVQELVDCDLYECNWGYQPDGYITVIQLGGLQTETDYPYVEKKMKCAFDRVRAAATIKDWRQVPRDEREMAQWLYEKGPMTAELNATVLQLYCNGVLHPRKRECDPHERRNVVLIVGYGVERSQRGGIPYWIIKNSWGTDHGEGGYVKMYRGDGTCGLNRFPTTAVL